MQGIPLTRCAFLIPYAHILTEIGAPTARLLADNRLPTSLEENYDHFVPILPAINFAFAGGRSQGIPDLGCLAANLVSFGDLTGCMQTAILHSPTLYSALEQLVKLVPLEDTNTRIWLELDAHKLRVCSTLAGAQGLPNLQFSQWLQNLPIIAIVRQFLGADWAPETLAFEARFTPSVDTEAQWPNTRILTGQRASWIDIPVDQLSQPCRAEPQSVLDPGLDKSIHDCTDTIAMIRLMLPSYLSGTVPTIAEVAEMAGTSTRSLQRKLSLGSVSYSGLVAQARYEYAAGLLSNTDEKIISVAFAAGYSDPAHLTRAFRRIAGITPRAYRQTLQSLQAPKLDEIEFETT